MRLDKRFKSPKILRGQIVIVPEKAPITHPVDFKDAFILPGRYIVLSTHPFGITVSPEKAIPTATGKNEIYGIEWQFTDKWELAE